MSRRLTDRLPLAILAALFLAAGAVYNVNSPLFEAPDEVWHFAHIRYVVQKNALPVQGARQGEEAAQQEASQPPLYYVLASALVRSIDISDFEQRGHLNPQAAPGLPYSDGNKNMVIPVPAPFPWQGTALAVHLVRAFSQILGLITVLCAYALGRQIWRGASGHALAWITAAAVAFNPQFLFITSSINNDNMMTALASLTVVAVIGMAATPGLPSYRRTIVLGVLAGLAALSKLTAVALIGFVLLAFLVMAMRARQTTSLRDWAMRALAFGATAALIAGWWYVRNAMLYGDITGLRPMLEWVGQRRLDLPGLMHELDGLELSYWAVFGWFNVLVTDEWVYTVLRAVARLAALGWLVMLIRWFVLRRTGRHAAAARQSGDADPFALGLAALWSAIVLAALVRWTATTPGSQGRLLFPAIISNAALLVAGLSAFVPRRWRVPLLIVPIAGLFVLALISPQRYIAPAYARPLVLPAEPASMQRQARLRYGDDELELLGYALDRETALPGDEIAITLHIEALKKLETDYSLFIHLWGTDMEWLGARDSYPGRGTMPTSQMDAGQIIEDRYLVTIAPTATVPSRIQIEIGFYEHESGRRLWATSPDGTRSELPFVGRMKLAAPEAGNRELRPPVLTYGDAISLISADVQAPACIQPGSTITVVTTWQASSVIASDYTIFMQVVDDASTIVAQRDTQPRAGDYPTSYWEPGQIVTDTRTLKLPASMAPGRYRIVTGLYLLATGERMPAHSATGPADEDWAVIHECRVE